ncbi:SpoIIE family protein phosphatase [Streptomyces sp. PCS3-D2]|uniref:SpoIIE family protein phosphatase n=1 Tax=Streptomyces sp. PCS3-D2 TaxID=1460244 RepID=UPI00056C4549|nr:SpoIIE family protein phosphatase [Streptomyces sp. PCS3-D2]WKV71036.1 SpoIIE family protein phosphatase [Streptomyces sp. PCS3-D2]
MSARLSRGAHSVAGQVFALQAVIVVLLITAAALALVFQARFDSQRDARNRSLAAAEAFAHAPGLPEALMSRDPTAALQPLAESARKAAGLDFIAVMDLRGVRYTDPRPELIGQRASDVSRAAAGESFTQVFQGQPSDAVRAVVPVRNADGTVVGLVGTGIEVQNVSHAVEGQLPLLVGATAAGLLLGTAGAALVSRRLLRQTRGLGAAEMTRMNEHHEAVLHAVREGVLIIGNDQRLLLANDEARRLLDLPRDAEERRVGDLGLDPRTTELLASGRVVTDHVHLAGDRLLAVNVRPTMAYAGRPAGRVVTLRDTTELASVSGRAEVARSRLQLLYDAGVRIGTTLDVARTAEELSEVAVPRFADFVTVELLEPVLRGDEPSVGGVYTEMRRAAITGVRTDSPLQPVGDLIRFEVPTAPMAAALDAGHAVLAADLNAAMGWRAQDSQGTRMALDYGLHSLISVPLQARGVVLGMANFWRADTPEPFDEEDLSFAEELGARAAVSIDNARRFTREHAMAVTLQRSLLPRVLPDQSAVDVAHRYLPATAGVGGDWFDVIQLPGARVALVVGDVVGHGVHAAATMGRLRTAVHNFSTLDLPPDELLGHLDELINRIDQDETGEGGGNGAGDPDGNGGGAGQEDAGPDGAAEPASAVTGATCLYAVYDPVSGRCRMASAGHPGPALVHPDGRVEFPELPAGLPLGVGGMPFEAVEFQLPEGSRLALFTDGLVEDRDRDFDTGLRLLTDALSRRGRTPDEACSDVLATMLFPVPSDDIALLIADTRRMEADRIAEWEVPGEPSAVSRVRNAGSAQLVEWGMEDSAFAAELILSELVTNAIRYGSAPVGVRLLRDRSLICEVSDSSNTSPHLRYAATTDEGGRGLFLVAQYAERWGTRYTDRGKVIWAELPLTGGSDPQPPEPPDLDALEDMAW